MFVRRRVGVIIGCKLFHRCLALFVVSDILELHSVVVLIHLSLTFGCCIWFLFDSYGCFAIYRLRTKVEIANYFILGCIAFTERLVQKGMWIGFISFFLNQKN